jgi:hypothetical protein
MAIGRKTGGGSRKGRPNKMNSDLKAMILGALDDAGGQQYLAEQARANPAAFMTLLGKVLPHQVGGVPGEPIGISMSLEEAQAAARKAIEESFAEPVLLEAKDYREVNEPRSEEQPIGRPAASVDLDRRQALEKRRERSTLPLCLPASPVRRRSRGAHRGGSFMSA